MKILVCGDEIVDRYWFGEVERVSPEAPVVVVKMGGRGEEVRRGAARNVEMNVRSLGGDCCGLYGRGEQPVEKVRVIARGQQLLRLDFDHRQESVDVKCFEEMAKDCGMVIFSDYGKGSLVGIEGLMGVARGLGMKVLVDPSGYDGLVYRGADVLKLNLNQLKAMGIGWAEEGELESKILELRMRCDLGAVVLTRAQEGLSVYDDKGGVHFPAVAREVYDVTGAGDTVIAVLGVFLAEGRSLIEAAELANRAGGIVVGKFGTATVSREELGV